MSLFLPTPYDQAVKPLDFTPAKDPYAGSGGLFLASAEEAFTLNITTSALRYANYWYQGLTGRQLDQAEFDAEVEQAGLRGFIEFKEDMTAEQLQATIKYVKAQQKRWAIQRGSSNGLMDSVLGLGASFLGSMVDPVELALMFTPGLQVGNAMRKSTMQAALKMPMARIKQIQRNAPNVYRKLLVENPAALGSATLKGALTRGALIGEAEAVIREPMLYGFNNAMQVEYTPVDSLMNLTVAPMLSGLIHGMGHKLNKHWTQPNMAKALTDQEFPETDIFLLNELNNSAEDFFRRMDYMEGRIRGEEQTRGKPFTEAERGEWVEQYFNLVLNRNANKFATEDLADNMTRRGFLKGLAAFSVSTQFTDFNIAANYRNVVNFLIHAAEKDRAIFEGKSGEASGVQFRSNRLFFKEEPSTYKYRPEISPEKLQSRIDRKNKRKARLKRKIQLQLDRDAAGRLNLQEKIEATTGEAAITGSQRVLGMPQMWLDTLIMLQRSLAESMEGPSNMLVGRDRASVRQHLRELEQIADTIAELRSRHLALAEEDFVQANGRNPTEAELDAYANKLFNDEIELYGRQLETYRIILEESSAPRVERTLADEVVDQMRSWASFEERGNVIVGHSRAIPDPKAEVGEFTPGTVFARDTGRPMGAVDPDFGGPVTSTGKVGDIEILRAGNPYTAAQQRANYRLSYQRLMNNSRPHINGEEAALSKIFKLAFGSEIRFLDRAAAQRMGIQGTTVARMAGTLFITAADRPTMMYVAGHEFSHSLKWRNPDLYFKFVSSVLSNPDSEKIVLNAMKRTLAEQNPSEVKALPQGKQLEEAFGNVMGELMNNKDFWRALGQNMEPSAWNSLKKELVSFFNEFLESVRQVIQHLGFRDTRFLSREQRTGEKTDLFNGVSADNLQALAREVGEILETLDPKANHLRELLDEFGPDPKRKTRTAMARMDRLFGKQLAEMADERFDLRGLFADVAEWEAEMNALVFSFENESAAVALMGGTGFGKSPLMPKEKIYGSVEQYAVSFASLHDPVYAEGYATYLIHKAKLDSEIQLHTEAAKKVQVEIKKNNTLAEKYQKDKNWPAWQRAKARNDDYLKTLKFHTENKHKLQFAKRDLAGDWVKRLNISVTEREDGIIVRWRRPDPGTKMVEQTFVEGQPREHFASGGVQAIQRWNPDANRYEVIMINPEEGRPLTNEEVAEEMNFVFKEDPEYWNYGDYHTQTDKGLNMTDSQLYKATNMSRSSGDPAKDIEFVRGVWDWQTGKYERPELSKTPLSESALPKDFTLKGKPKSRMPARTTVQSYPWNPGGVYETGNHAAEGIDRMTSRHILGLDSEGRSFIERTGRKAQSVLKRGMDRLSARLHPSQQEIEPILRRVQNEAQLLQGYKADRTVKEILDSLDENLWNQVELESRFIWEATPSQAAEAAVPVTPAMSVQDRALLSELNKLNRNQFNEWKAMNMLAKANQHKKSLNQFLEDILRIKSYQTWSESQLIDFYQRIRNNEVDNFRRREAGEATVSLKTELYNEARQMMLSAVRNEQARRSWVDGAKKQKNQKLWLLSQLDGLFRKGLSPEDTGAPITSRMAARRTKEIMPLVYVLGRYNVWDEFTARNSDLARRVFAYIETGDQKYIGKRPEIREIGEVIKALNKQQVFGLKQNGARLTHREDYTISARHNGAQIRKVGFEEWAEYIFPLLDWDKTFDRLGYSLKPEERSKKVAMGYLQRVYEDIVNNRFREMDNPVDELLINYNSEVSQRRTLIFNPGKLFDYDNQYGSGAPAHALLEQIQRRSDLSELTGIFGPNPKETWSKIKNSLGLEEKGELGIDHMNALVRFFIGEMDYPHNKKWSDLGQMARSFTNTALLGNAGISAVVDVAQSMDTLKYLGVDLGSWNREYLKALRRSWKRQKSPYQMMFRAQAAGLDSILGAGSRRILGEVAGYGRVRELNDLMFRVNGLNMWTTIAQEAMVDILNRNLPTLVNDKFFQGVLRRYGIDEADLSLMRRMAQKVEDIDGPVLKLTPDMLDVRSPQTAQKLRVMMDDFMRQAILEPDATSQIFGRGWAQAGTAWGETIRTVTQYMPFGLAIYQKTYRRMLNGYGEQGLGAVMGDPSNRRLLNMMSFVAWSMSLGYLTMNLKELAKGREPNYILNLDGLKVRKWIFQSGVMGPLADILWVRDKSDIPEMAVGPFFGMVSELGGEVLDLDTRGFLMDLERNSPFATLPVAGELRKNIFRNILGDGLVEAQDRHLKLLQRD